MRKCVFGERADSWLHIRTVGPGPLFSAYNRFGYCIPYLWKVKVMIGLRGCTCLSRFMLLRMLQSRFSYTHLVCTLTVEGSHGMTLGVKLFWLVSATDFTQTAKSWLENTGLWTFSERTDFHSTSQSRAPSTYMVTNHRLRKHQLFCLALWFIINCCWLTC